MSYSASISISGEAHARFRAAADARGITLHDLVRLAFPDILERPPSRSKLAAFRESTAQRRAEVAAARTRTNGRHKGSVPDKPAVAMSDATYERVAAAAKQRGCSLAAIVRMACADILEPEQPR